MTRTCIIAAVACALAAAACDRTYMTPSHGKSFRQTFAVQTVNPDRQTDPKAVHGLDSQEAAIISASYRKALGPKEDTSGANQGPLLMYSPRSAAAAQGGNMPPPSVPGGN
jgi:hypothetical protein